MQLQFCALDSLDMHALVKLQNYVDLALTPCSMDVNRRQQYTKLCRPGIDSM